MSRAEYSGLEHDQTSHDLFEAQAETIQMLNIYAEFAEKYLAIPVIKGVKTEKERFAGAVDTYTIEAMMHDGKALQSGTSHFFGDGFAKAFGIQYADKENKLATPFQTSWGVSTRLIGAIIMTHGDDNGLVLPPAIAPIQLIVVPIAAHKEGVTEKAEEVTARLKAVCRAKIDNSDNSPGWKFAEYEMKGVPLRLELGPRDIENNQCVVVRRDTREKIVVSLDDIETKLGEILEQMQADMFERALAHREEHTYDAVEFEEFCKIADEKPGFIRAMWCGDQACEDKIKEDAGCTSRCMPFEQKELYHKCICC
jgi:prolyl-tRNA synthetase